MGTGRRVRCVGPSGTRFTRDVDVAVAVPDDNAAESLVHSLLSKYRIDASIEQDAMGRLSTVRLIRSGVRTGQEVIVDVLFASSGIEPEIVAYAEQIEVLAGLRVPVASTGHLIAVKLLARDDRTRPQDLADLNALMAVAMPADLEIARQGTTLITRRGFDRGRDLDAALTELINQRRPQ
jgi:predicted nucleotidyltransferase